MSSINVDDRLSSLPEEIHIYILSLMPIKFAIRTSVLSKKWRYTWTFVTNLDFNDNHGKYISSENVDRVMELCKSSQIQLYRLHFSKRCYEKSVVSNWISKAVGLNIHELDICVMKFELPLNFTCKTLTKLRLNRSHHDQSVWEFPSSIYLPSLKTLDIDVFGNPFVNAFKLIRGCPMLEDLSLTVSWPNYEEDYVFRIPTLKRLSLTWLECATPINKVVLWVPNLEYLYVGGVLCSSFVVEDLSSLVEVSVSLRYITYDHLWVEFLKGVRGVKSLLIQSKVLLNVHSMPIIPNMRNLEINCCADFEVISQFLECSPKLQHICIEKNGEYSWTEPKLVPACIRTNLTSLKFSNSKGQRCDIEFLEYILRNAEVLKTVTILWKNLCVKEGMLLVAEVLKFPRASRHCEIHFHGDWLRKGEDTSWYLSRLGLTPTFRGVVFACLD